MNEAASGAIFGVVRAARLSLFVPKNEKVQATWVRCTFPPVKSFPSGIDPTGVFSYDSRSRMLPPELKGNASLLACDRVKCAPAKSNMKSSV